MWFLLVGTPLCSQSYVTKIDYFGVEEGLSHRFVHMTFQDSRGLIWIATRQGLNRFDGHSFKHFNQKEFDFSSNIIYNINQDAENWLWIFSSKEGNETHWDFIDFLHPLTLKTLKWKERFPDFPLADIVECSFDGAGQVIIETKNNSIFLLNKVGQFKVIPIQNLNPINPVWPTSRNSFWGIIKNKKNSSWIEIDYKGHVLKKVEIPQNEKIITIGEDLNGHFYYELETEKLEIYCIKQNGQLTVFNSENNQLQNVKEKMLMTHHKFYINPINQSKWWFLNNELLVEYPNGTIIRFDNNEYPQDIRHNHILFDRNGNAWISSVHGVFRFQIKESPFTNYLNTKIEKQFLNDNFECRGIYTTDNGDFFVNTTERAFHLSKAGTILNDNLLNIKSDWPVHGIYEDNEKDLWFASFFPIKMNAQTGELQYFQNPLCNEEFRVWTINEDTTGTIWFAGTDGSLLYKRCREQELNCFKNYGNFQELRDNCIQDILRDSIGNFWLAANTGLYYFNPYSGQVLDRFWTGGSGNHYLPFNSILDIHCDQKGSLWLASGGGGLIRFDPSSLLKDAIINPLKNFTIHEGLSSNILYSIEEDNQGCLWIGSEYGLIRFDKKNEDAYAFLPKHGLPHHELNRLSHFKTKDGKMYFGGLNGFSGFHPDSITIQSTSNSPLVVLDINQYDGKQNKMANKLVDFQDKQKIVLQPRDRLLEIEFSLLDYDDNDRIRYNYQIAPLEKTWIELQENHLSLSGLPYGDFELRIRGQSATGLFSNQMITIPIIVAKPWFLKTWVIVLSFVFAALLIGMFFSVRTRQLKKQRKHLREEVNRQTNIISSQNQELLNKTHELSRLDKAKSRFFANVSHELRTPLTLLLGPISMVLKRNKLEKKDLNLLSTAQNNGLELQKLTNELLDLSRMEADKLELKTKPVRLFPLFKRYFSAFESRAHFKNISFTYKYEAEEDLIVNIDQDKFEKIVFNFLSNALKFTPQNGQVELSLFQGEKTLRLMVRDTGRGIDLVDIEHVFERFYQTNKEDAPAEGGTGIGLAIVKEYASLFKGKVGVKSQLKEGSEFYFEWPYSKVKIPGPENLVPLNEEVRRDNTHVYPASISKQENSQDINDKRAKIMVVEDNPDMRDFIQLILEEHYWVFCMEDGLKAYKYFDNILNSGGNLESSKVNLDVDLIISDVMMPEMDGFQLIEKLKSHEVLSSIPIVMLTARADIHDKLKALRIGVDDYMLKPFLESEVLVRIKNILDRQVSRQATIRNDDLVEAAPASGVLVQSKLENNAWLKQLETLVTAEVQNDLLTVSWLAEQLNISERHLQRQLKLLTGLSPSQYIREVRLQEARRLLESRIFSSVKVTASKVSFRDPNYFSRLFTDRFGKHPSKFL